MAKEGEIKKIYSGLTSNVTLTQALPRKIFERRDITVAVRKTLSGQDAMAGNLKIYGAINDEDSWYEHIGTVSLIAAASETEHWLYPNSIAGPVAATMVPTKATFLYLRFVVESIANGTIDVWMHEIEC